MKQKINFSLLSSSMIIHLIQSPIRFQIINLIKLIVNLVKSLILIF